MLPEITTASIKRQRKEEKRRFVSPLFRQTKCRARSSRTATSNARRKFPDGGQRSRKSPNSAWLVRFPHDHGDDGVDPADTRRADRSSAGRRPGGAITMVALASNSSRSPWGTPRNRCRHSRGQARSHIAQRRHRLVPRMAGMSPRNAISSCAVIRLVGHVGGEVMHLPVSRNRQMRRIDRAVDHHDAVFARVAVLAPGVEIFDHQQSSPGRPAPPWRDRRLSPQGRSCARCDSRASAAAAEMQNRSPIQAAPSETGENARGRIATRLRRHHARHGRSRAALSMRPVVITARGSLMTGALVRAIRRIAASSAGWHRSGSPMALKISRCGGNGVAGSR